MIVAANLTKDYVILNRPKDVFRLIPPFDRGGGLSRHRALDDVSFHVENGEVLGVIGANGSGKSTLLKLLSGVSSPTAGRLDVRGRISAILEVSTGFSEGLSGRKNIQRRLMIQGLTQREIKHLVPEIIEFSELQDVIDEPARTYSMGMKAKLAFSVVTSAIYDVVLLDEIMAVGDEHFRAKSFRRIRDICRSGRTVVAASHDSSFVERLCDRAIWLDRGRIRSQGEAHATCAAYWGQDPEKADVGYPREFGQIDSVAVHMLDRKMRIASRIRIFKPTPDLQYQIAVRDNRLGVVSALMNTRRSGVRLPTHKGVLRLVTEFEMPAGLDKGLVGTSLLVGGGRENVVVQDDWGWATGRQIYFKDLGRSDGRAYIQKPLEWRRCS